MTDDKICLRCGQRHEEPECRITALVAAQCSIFLDSDDDIVLCLRSEEEGVEHRVGYCMPPFRAVEVANGILDAAIEANKRQRGDLIEKIKRFTERVSEREKSGPPPEFEGTNPWAKPKEN